MTTLAQARPPSPEETLAPTALSQYISDVGSNPFFTAQQQGDGQTTMGSGNGAGWIDYSKFPELADALAQMQGNEISGGGASGAALTSRLNELGWRTYEEPVRQGAFNSGQVRRGFVDANGNFVGGGPQLIETPRDEGFWYGALAGGALAGGAAAGVGSGAGAAGTGAEAAMAAAEGYAGGAAAGTTAAGVGAAAPTLAATGGSAAAGGAGMAVADYLTIGSMVGGLIQGERARDAAQDAAAAGLAATTAASDRMAGIAERQLTMAERAYADQQALVQRLMPAYEEQMRLSQQEMQRSIERGDSAWNEYETVWRPQERAFAARSAELADPSRIEQNAQRAGATAAERYDTATTSATRDMTAAGMAPDRVAAFQAAARLEGAKGTAGAVDTARREGEIGALGILDNAARFARNMPSQGIQTAQLATTQGNAAIGAGNAAINAGAAPTQTAGPLLGAAGNMYAGIGSLAGQGANIARQGANDSLAFYGDLINAGANLFGMNNRPPR